MNEDDGMVTMIIGVLSDGLKIEVSLMISLLNGSANGKSVIET